MRFCIDAGPGSGKTTLATFIPKLLRGEAIPSFFTEAQQNILRTIKSEIGTATSFLFLTFLKNHEANLKSKTNEPVYTFSAYGFKKLAEQHTVKFNPKRQLNYLLKNYDKNAVFEALPYVKRCQRDLLEGSVQDIGNIQERYTMSDTNLSVYDLSGMVTDTLDYLKKPDGTISYECMQWMPFYFDCFKPDYDVVICDEAQDLSLPRYEISKLVAKHQIYIGDAAQSINAWDGADPNQFAQIGRSSIVMPMVDCFRCPPNVISYANQIVQRANPVIPVKTKDIPFKRGDHRAINWSIPPRDVLIQGRYNKTLIQHCVKWRNLGHSCYVVGKDVCNTLMSHTRSISFGSPNGLLGKMAKFENKIADKPSWQQAYWTDMHESIRAVYKQGDSFADIEASLKAVFERQPNSLPLLTVHKAKGAEVPHNFIIEPITGFEGPFTQEPQIKFVAYTRTQENTTQLVS